jgi:hypothetical protein
MVLKGNSMLCKIPQPVTFKLTEEHKSHIQIMAEEIHACPVRSRGRKFETIYKAVKNGAILEYALVAQGAVKNDATFDHTDPLTYCWDVFWDGKRTEVKCLYFDSSMSWVSFPLRNVQTFINTTQRSKNLVDIIIFGCYDETSEGVISAKWRLIAPSDTFKDMLRKCNTKYKNSYDSFTGELKYFYSHKTEKRSIFIS